MKVVKNIVTGLFLLTSLSIFGNQTDSLLIKLQSLPQDSNRVLLLKEVAWMYKSNEPQKAIYYSNKGLKLSKSLDYEKGIAEHSFVLGTVYLNLGQYEKSLKFLQRAKDIYLAHDEQENIARTNNNIGNLYWYYSEYDKALKYYKQAFRVLQHQDNKRTISHVLNNIGIIYEQKNVIDSALHFHNKSLALKKEINDTTGIRFSQHNIGMVYLHQKMYEKSLDYLLKAVKNGDKYLGRIDLAHFYNNVGYNYLHLNDYDRARLYLQQAENLASQTNARDVLKKSYLYLSKLDSVQGNYHKSLRYFQYHAHLKDSIYNIQKSNQLADLELLYETEKKDKENILLKSKLMVKESELKKKNLVYYSFLVFTMLLSIIVVLLYKFNKQKSRINREINTKNQEITAINKRLEEMNSSKDRFFSILAHDLKNPLHTVIGFTELLADRYEELSEKEKKQYINLIMNSSKNVYGLLENLLYWSNTQSERIQFIQEKHDLHKLVNQAFRFLSPAASQKNIELISKVSLKTMIYGDKDMIVIILRNLVSNAIKFSHPGNSIMITAKKIENKEIEICIIDHGIGLHQEDINNILTSDNSISTIGTSGEQGTGLGLVLCKEFIQQHGSHLKIKSTPGKGSVFSFNLSLSETDIKV